jgi:putative colanic acid biosynthesis UDP-glucose lipid carrier transferase
MTAEAQLYRPTPVSRRAPGEPAQHASSGGSARSIFFAGDWRVVLRGSLRAADLVLIAAAAVLSFRCRYGTFDLPVLYRWQVLAVCVIAAQGLHVAGVYVPGGFRRHCAQIAVVWAVSMLAVLAIIFFEKAGNDISRSWLVLWAVASIASLLALRAACWLGGARLHRNRLASHVAVVGLHGAAERLARRIADTSNGDVAVCGVFDLPGQNRATSGTRTIDELTELARRERIDEIVVAVPCTDWQTLERTLNTLGTLPVDVKLCLDIAGESSEHGTPIVMPTVLVFRRPLSGWRIVTKRMMDMTLAAVALVFFSPLMLAIALLIPLDSAGPIIFRQQRFGFNQQRIMVHKFRTMACDCAADLGVPQARRNDPRVTRIGRFLRRTSLDELPQLFDVLAGTMSLVGPRPHAVVHDQRYAALIDGYLARHRVLPGITGWAQVNRLRGETETIDKMKRRIEHDLYYIDHWSPFLDLRILVRTFGALRDPNAY